MIQKFECKEPGCDDKEVVYEEYEPVDATVKMKMQSQVKVRTYLECKNHHWHWYEVVVTK